MKTLTIAQYNEVAVSNRQSVVKSLRSFLHNDVLTLAKNTIVEIDCKDFLQSEDFHYYNSKKMIDKEFNGKLEVKFLLHGQARCNKILVKVL